MARLFVTGINLNKNELQNARIQNLSSAPSSPVVGQIYYNTSDNVMYYYNGLSSPDGPWMAMSGSDEAIQDIISSAVAGGVGLTASYDDASGILTIDLDDTSVTAGEYGSSTKIPTFTVDEQGRLTAAGEADVATNLSIAGDTGTDTVDLLNDVLTVAGGEGIDVDVTDSTITVSAELASDTNKGVASFDSTDFSVTDGNVVLNDDNIEDIVANLIVAGTGLDVDYNDNDGKLTLDIDSTVVTKDDTQTLTNKTLGSDTTLGTTGNAVSLGENLDASNYKIINLGTPTEGTDAVNKAYVDGMSSGLTWKQAVNLLWDDVNASLSGNTLELVIDGHPVLGQEHSGYRILITAGANKGIWDYQDNGTTWTLTRSSDADANAELIGAAVFVMEGTTYGSTSWVQSNHYIADFANQDWTQFSGQGTYLAGSGLSLDGNTFSVDVTPSSGHASLSNTGGAVEVIVNTADGLEVTENGLGINNGTGLTFDAGALTFDTANGYGTRKLGFYVGNGTDTLYSLEHNLGTRDITVQVFENSSPYAQVEADVEHHDSNNVKIKFASAPSNDEYRVVVVG